MNGAIPTLLDAWGYPLLFLLVGLDSLGVPLPGETALVTAAALAALGHLSISAVVATAAAAGVIGDAAGYWIGRTGGVALVRRYGRFIRLNESDLARGHAFFERYGPKAIFFGRFLAFLRTWVALLAGTNAMSYRTFTLYNALGAASWAVLVGMVGYLLGHNLPQLEHYVARASLAGALIVVAAGGLVVAWGWLHVGAIARFHTACAARRERKSAVPRKPATDVPTRAWPSAPGVEPATVPGRDDEHDTPH